MRRSISLMAFAVLLVLLGVAVSGCARADSVTAEFPGSLAGTSWKAIEWRSDTAGSVTPVEGLDARIRFTGETTLKMTADPGITWSGDYEDRMAEFEQTFIISDLEANANKIPVNAQLFAGLVSATRSYVRAEDTLTLQDREGATLVVLERVD